MTLQNTQHKIAIIKFGSSILSKKKEDVLKAIHEVYRYIREHYKVLVVVSALGNTTDELDNLAKHIFNEAEIESEPKAYAELLATGEISSASLFTISLNHSGIHAVKLNHQILKTQGPILNSQPVSLETKDILAAFDNHSVAVIPGFIGADDAHPVTLLGRGGSDFSAIFIAHTLNAAECVLYKDTDGIFNKDPALYKDAICYKNITFQDCLRLDYPVVQYKTVEFAQSHHYLFKAKALGSDQGTLIGAHSSTVYSKTHLPTTSKKLKVLLFGLGTVGYGVYHHLLSENTLFEVVGIGVNDLLKHQHRDIPAHIISDNFSEIQLRNADIVIELIGEPTLAEKIITNSLQQGRHVVTANKFLLSEKGVYLSQLASQHRAHLLYSAAVAGAIPILEILTHYKNNHAEEKIKSVSGILNGTCNFILEKMTQGISLSEAITLAQNAGFAEADPTLDIQGLDAAQKLAIITQLIFDKDPSHLETKGICDIEEALILETAKENQVIKLIAECKITHHGIHATVKPQAVANDHPFAQVKGADNCILIETVNNKIIKLDGKGAGRWPTAEAVFADLLQLSRKTRYIQGEAS